MILGVPIQWLNIDFKDKSYVDATLPTSFRSSLYKVYFTDCVVASTTSTYTTGLSWSIGASSISKVRVVTTDGSAGRVCAFAIGK